MNATTDGAADFATEQRILAQVLAAPPSMRHVRDIHGRRKDRILAGSEDLPPESDTVAAREFPIEACRECQGGRKRRRTLVPAYAVWSVAVVERYEVLRLDRREVMQRDGYLVLPRQPVHALQSAVNSLFPAARCEPLGVVGDQAVSP